MTFEEEVIKLSIDEFENFHKLDIVKQERIRNAAFEEFAIQSYDKASTNSIIKKAGIGKGMLFYYFQNKQTLYHYLIDYGLTFIEEEYVNKIDTAIPDFIERMVKNAQIKYQAIGQRPEISQFLANVLWHEDAALPEATVEEYHDLMKFALDKFYDFSTIDRNLLRDDLPADKTFKLIELTINGFLQEVAADNAREVLSDEQLKAKWTKFYDYLAILKQVYYK